MENKIVNGAQPTSECWLHSLVGYVPLTIFADQGACHFRDVGQFMSLNCFIYSVNDFIQSN